MKNITAKCKQALIYIVLSWGSWSPVEHQNKSADTVEKSAAKEHKASVQYIFRGIFFPGKYINLGCLCYVSETYILQQPLLHA